MISFLKILLQNKIFYKQFILCISHISTYIQNLIMTTVYEMNLHAHVLVNQIIHITKSKEIKHKAPLLQSTADSSFPPHYMYITIYITRLIKFSLQINIHCTFNIELVVKKPPKNPGKLELHKDRSITLQ